MEAAADAELEAPVAKQDGFVDPESRAPTDAAWTFTEPHGA